MVFLSVGRDRLIFMIDLSYVVAFDLETTGVDVLNDRIVTASIVYLDSVGNVIENWEWLVNPGIEIPEGASNVHGVTTEHANEFGSNPATSVWEIASTLAYFFINGVPVIAYNAAYDFSLLNAEVIRHLDCPEGFERFLEGRATLDRLIDPYIIDLKMDKYRKGSRTLTAAASHYHVELENAHTSYADCVAAAEVARGLWTAFPALGEGTYPELHELQVDWYREIMEDRAAYFKKQGKEMSDFSTVWPVRTV